jgi:glycosyltransferase involved in cell wall biosynthesis
VIERNWAGANVMQQVSVILPVYNAEEFLTEALQSVLNQSHHSFELIAMDDGSTDGSTEILAEFARRDKRVAMHRRQNRGVAATANECLEKARNELVVRIDADDVMLPNRIERQVSFMQQHQAISVASCYAWLIDRKGKVLARAKPEVDIERGIRECEPNYFVSLIQPATIMRRQHVAAVGGYSSGYRFAEDRELWGRLVVAGYRLGVQPEFLVKQRIHRSSLTGQSMRQNEVVCRFIDGNIRRVLQGQPSLSFEVFLDQRRKLSLFKRLARSGEELGSVFYKQATRDYAERRWWSLFRHGTSAVCLSPAYGIRILQKLAFRGMA